jgi:hypothetical protein
MLWWTRVAPAKSNDFWVWVTIVSGIWAITIPLYYVRDRMRAFSEVDRSRREG